MTRAISSLSLRTIQIYTQKQLIPDTSRSKIRIYQQVQPSSRIQKISRRGILSKAISLKAKELVSRYDEILKSLENPSSSPATAQKELAKLAPISQLYKTFLSIAEDRVSLEELMEEARLVEDKDLQEECLSELEQLNRKEKKYETRITNAVLPKDEDDCNSDAILEIRAGTGGGEASLFASELLSAYEKTIKSRGWSYEILTLNKTDLGGIRDAVLSIASKSYGGGGYLDEEDEDDPTTNLGPYGFFKYESGVHRVQRVPVNDVRIHTSTASVAILPSLSDNDSTNETMLPTTELKIDTMRASGAGGQHVNTTESAVRITHIPTGITATIQDERSQHKNKSKALKLITARVRAKLREEEELKQSSTKRSLMGGGTRSERVRTYNFPQDRVTDHRCKHSEYGIEKLMSSGSDGVGDGIDGLVGIFLPFLNQMHKEEMLKMMEDEHCNKNNSK